MNRNRFRHRNIQDHYLKCFNKLLDAIIESGFKIKCDGLIDCKPITAEYTQVILENFCLTVNKEIDRIFREDLLEVKSLKEDTYGN